MILVFNAFVNSYLELDNVIACENEKKRKRHLASKFIRQEFYDNAIARDKDKDTSIASKFIHSKLYQSRCL